MKSSHRLLVSVLLPLAIAGIGRATAQTVIVVCHPCILTYQDCLDSGRSPSYCQAYAQTCCPPPSATPAAAQPVADRTQEPRRA